jgi:anti-sigma B factor antagonist
MNVEIMDLEDKTVVSISGRELMAGNVRNFKDAVAQTLESRDKIIIDLGNLEFIDSVGLGALVTCLKRVRQHHGEIKLCRMSESVQHLFHMVKLERVFQIFDSLDAALASY